MKKLSITLLISCLALWASAQITTTIAPRLEEKTVSEPLGEYTGEENFLPKEKVRQYIG